MRELAAQGFITAKLREKQDVFVILCFLRLAETIEASNVVRPFWIFETEEPVIHPVGFHRNPDRIGQILTSVNHDRLACRPAGSESKLIPHHAKTPIFHCLRQPRHRRLPSECFFPPLRPWQIIHDRIGRPGKNRRIHVRGIAKEIDLRQLAAL